MMRTGHHRQVGVMGVNPSVPAAGGMLGFALALAHPRSLPQPWWTLDEGVGGGIDVIS